MVGTDEACELESGPSVGRPQRDHLGTRVRHANDGVEERAPQERPPLQLEAEPEEFVTVSRSATVIPT